MRQLLRAISYAKNLWPYYIGVIITSIITAAFALLVPFLFKSATDLVVLATSGGGGEDFVRQAIWLAVVLLALDVGGILFKNIGGYLGDLMAIRLRSQLSTRYYEHLLTLDQGYYDNELTGTIINRLNRAITEVTQFLNILANSFFQMFLTAVVTIFIVGYYSWRLALLVILIYPLFGWLTTLTSKRWQKFQHIKNSEIDSASGRFAEVISQIKVVKSFAREALELSSFAKKFLKTIDITKKQSRYWHSMDVGRGSVLAAIFFGIYILLFTETVKGVFTIGEMVLLITLVNMVRTPIFSMSFIIDNYQRAVTGSYEFVSVMTTQPTILDSKNASGLSVKNGRVEFKDVDFSYDKFTPVLKSISFDMEKGERLALVGHSGEGKTTISNLLMRLYDPDSGTITIDGMDISKVTMLSLRKNIAAVFQDPALFSGTIKENIAYGRPDASDEEILKAAKAANADEFIVKLKDGYSSVVGERGIKLSGGQKQRISIARAILKDSPVLILDEATSSLDSKSEKLVQTALEKLMKGRTTLIIAHRLSTIASVDKIVTLKNGKVDEVGSPSELAKSGGIYSQLLELQGESNPRSKKRLQDFEMHA